MPNISDTRHNELLRIEDELNMKKHREATSLFVDKLLENVGTLLALTPYVDWPEMAKIAYFNIADRANFHYGALLYKDNLPTKPL